MQFIRDTNKDDEEEGLVEAMVRSYTTTADRQGTMRDDSNPYPALLGIDSAIDMNEVINLKKRTMSFERKTIWVVVPLDPTEGAHYTKRVHGYEESDDALDQIYKIIARDQD